MLFHPTSPAAADSDLHAVLRELWSGVRSLLADRLAAMTLDFIQYALVDVRDKPASDWSDRG